MVNNTPGIYDTGTATVDVGETLVEFQAVPDLTTAVRPGDRFGGHVGLSIRITAVTADTVTLAAPWPGPAQTAEPYEIVFTPYDLGYREGVQKILDRYGQGALPALAELEGVDLGVPMFTGPSTMTVLTRQEMTQGARYDVQVADLAGRAAYDNQAVGFAVLVANTGDGRSAIYSRDGTAGNWSAPAFVTGPSITLDIIEVDEVDYGVPPEVELFPVAGGYGLTFAIPRGMIIVPGDTTTLAPDQPAAVDFVPVAGGYRLDLSIPRGLTGDIDGVTPFWVSRISSDADAAAARQGLGVGTVGAINLPETPSGKVLGDGGTFIDPSGTHSRQPEEAKVDDYTLLPSDAGTLLAFDKGTPVVATLPSVAASDNEIYRLVNVGAGLLTVEPDGADLVDGAAPLALPTGSAADIWPDAAKSAWRAFVYSPAGDYLAKGQNLADLPDKLAARTSLGLAWETVLNEQRSSVAAIELLNLGDYRRLRGKIFVRPSQYTSINARFSDNNGSGYFDGATDYENSYLYGIAGNTAYQEDGAVAQIRVSATGAVGELGQRGATIEFELDRFNEVGANTWLTYKVLAVAYTNALVVGQGGGWCKQAVSFNAIQFFPAQGAIAYCDIVLEGLR